jgi:hypothetical protein
LNNIEAIDENTITISFYDKNTTIDLKNKNDRSVINLSSFLLSDKRVSSSAPPQVNQT